MISDPVAITLALAAVVYVALRLEESFRLFRALGAASVGILLGMLLSNAGLLPDTSPAYDFIMGPAVSAGIALILLSVDLRSVRNAGPRMLMAFMVGASLLQVITRSPAYGLVAVVAGIVILGWAAATRLRRRAIGGAAAIVAASVLMVAVPLARIVPQFRGIALWATIAAIGGAMIAIASTLEQGKARVAATVTRLDELMEGWE